MNEATFFVIMTNINGAVLLVVQTTCKKQSPRRRLIFPQLLQVFPAFYGTQRLLASCCNGYRIFPGGKERSGRDADPLPLLVP